MKPPKHALTSSMYLFSMAAIGTWFAWMAVVDNEPPFRYLTEEHGSRIVPDPVKQEGTIKTQWKLTQVTRDCPRQVERLYYDRDTNELITTQDATPLSMVVKKSASELSRSFDLPPGLPARTGYRARACFQCNFLQRVFPYSNCMISPQLSINIIP